MKEMFAFRGRLFEDLKPLVELAKNQSGIHMGNGQVSLFLSDDQSHVIIRGDKVEKDIEFPLSHPVERHPFGVIDGHIADLHKNDGGYWVYKT